MATRHLMHLGALLAAALLTFGCSGESGGVSVEDMARDGAMAAAQAADAAAGANPPSRRGSERGLGARGGRRQAGTQRRGPVAGHLVELAELVAMPPAIPENLGGKAIADMLKDDIDALAVEPDGTTYEPQHETGFTGPMP